MPIISAVTAEKVRRATAAGELITGNSSTFDASVGGWVAGGGTLPTLSRDISIHWGELSASLKIVVNGTADEYAELALAGTFKAGVAYHAALVVCAEGTSTNWLQTWAEFGVLGTFYGSHTDAKTIGGGVTPRGTDGYSVTNGWYGVLLRWIPTADRTGVKLRFGTHYWQASSEVFHIGLARARALALPSDPGLSIITQPTVPAALDEPMFAMSALDLRQTSSERGLYLQSVNGAGREAYIAVYSSAGIRLKAEGALDAATDLSGEGIRAYTGPDDVGLYMTEGADGQVQLYPDEAQDIELVDEASNYWYTRDNAGTYKSPLSRLHNILTGTVDPSAGGGVVHPMPAMYLRDNSGTTELWLATGTGATAWTKQTSP
jgi:hypothetical protein